MILGFRRSKVKVAVLENWVGVHGATSRVRIAT